MENNVEQSKTPEATAELISVFTKLQEDQQKLPDTKLSIFNLPSPTWNLPAILQRLGILEKDGKDLKPNLDTFLVFKKKYPGIDWIKYSLSFDALIGKNLQVGEINRQITGAVQRTEDTENIKERSIIILAALLPGLNSKNTVNLNNLTVDSTGPEIVILHDGEVQKIEGNNPSLQKLAVVSHLELLSSLGVQQINNFGQQLQNLRQEATNLGQKAKNTFVNTARTREFVRAFVVVQTLSLLIALSKNNFGIGVQEPIVVQEPTSTELALLGTQTALVQYAPGFSTVMDPQNLLQLSSRMVDKPDKETREFFKIFDIIYSPPPQSESFYTDLEKNLENIKKTGEDKLKALSHQERYNEEMVLNFLNVYDPKQLYYKEMVREKGLLYAAFYHLFNVDDVFYHLFNVREFIIDLKTVHDYPTE